MRGHAAASLIAHVAVDPLDDSLHPRPGWRRVAEELPGIVKQQVGLHVAAGQREHQRIVWQVLHRDQLSVGHDRVRLVGNIDDCVVAHLHQSTRNGQTPAAIAKRVDVLPQIERPGFEPLRFVHGRVLRIGTGTHEHQHRHGTTRFDVELAANPYSHVNATPSSRIGANIMHDCCHACWGSGLASGLPARWSIW